MNSRNHVMFATPSYFLFSAVAGIEPVRGAELWRVAPAVVGASEEVTEARASVWTVQGSLSAGWQLLSSDPWRLTMDVSVPVGLNVAAALPLPPAGAAGCSIDQLPPEKKQALWRGGKFVGGHVAGIASGAVTHERRAAAITLTLESGEYQLQMRCA